MKRTAAAIAAFALITAGCVRGQTTEAEQERMAPPTFEPAPSSTTTTAEDAQTNGPTTSTSAGEGGGIAPGNAGPATPTVQAIADRRGDLTPSLLDRPPPWADLTEVTVVRDADAWQVRHRLASAAPTSAPDAEHTMNIAMYADLDDDGDVDVEVWTTLADDGWGAAYFDNRRDRARFGRESGIEVTVSGAEVVARFAPALFDGVRSPRWAVRSEWGRFEAIGTSAMARDSVPDGDRSVTFP
jgi:hypothetical protein